MACEYCGEVDKFKLGLRSSFANDKLETKEICSSCLWEKLAGGLPYDERSILERKYVEERRSDNKRCLYPGLGQDSD